MGPEITHFRNLLSPASRARYVFWRAVGAKKPIDIRLKSGLAIRFRSGSATDYGVAWDIFLRGCYRSPEPISGVKRIIDLGSNVGYSCLFWCEQYPDARVLAFEPHPLHLTAIEGHLLENGFVRRVELVKAAAGVEKGTAYLRDAGSSSALTTEPADFTVPIVDLFPSLDGTIDILKIDIEGGEYELLGDERFAALDVRTIVLEWHKSSHVADGREWCQRKLHELGYRTVVGCEDLPMAGVIWAFAAE